MLDHLGQTKRTHNCGELRQEHAGQKVTIMGWVNSFRDHGSVLFLHLRDRAGITQVVFDDQYNAELLARAKHARSEYVLAVTGKCTLRDEKNFNPGMSTGEIEVIAEELKILNDSQTPPFEIDNCKASEELRLKYRYLDLRRTEMQRNFKLRHELALAARRVLYGEGFFEI
jgi:aspartyl-tRNA synthetase